MFAKLLSPEDRKNRYKVSTNQGKIGNSQLVDYVEKASETEIKQQYNVVIVSETLQIHNALENTLQHFSLNGKKIKLFNTPGLASAKKIAEEHPDIVLVIINDNIVVNGTYKVFVDFIRNELNNNDCYITLLENLLNLSSTENDTNKPETTGFEYARERLIDIARMVLLTNDMEKKIEGNNVLAGQKEEKEESKEEQPINLNRDRLYTSLAHDLKGPVGNIKLMLDFLTNEKDLLDQKSSKDLLNRVRESAHSVHEMLEDFLFWARMFKHDIYFHPSKIDLKEIIRSNILLLKSTAGAKKISIHQELDDEICVFADEYMTTTVVRNLIYNAIKFTEVGGIISITAKNKENGIQVNVLDNGIGIPRKTLDELFKSEINKTTRGTAFETGTGMGLALCRDFIEKNKGEITATSVENIGSIFSFVLPRA